MYVLYMYSMVHERRTRKRLEDPLQATRCEGQATSASACRAFGCEVDHVGNRVSRPLHVYFNSFVNRSYYRCPPTITGLLLSASKLASEWLSVEETCWRRSRDESCWQDDNNCLHRSSTGNWTKGHSAVTVETCRAVYISLAVDYGTVVYLLTLLWRSTVLCTHRAHLMHIWAGILLLMVMTTIPCIRCKFLSISVLVHQKVELPLYWTRVNSKLGTLTCYLTEPSITQRNSYNLYASFISSIMLTLGWFCACDVYQALFSPPCTIRSWEPGEEAESLGTNYVLIDGVFSASD